MRLGAPKAVTATAHKLARLFYRLWSVPEPASILGLFAVAGLGFASRRKLAEQADA